MTFLKSILGEKWKKRAFILLFIYTVVLSWPTAYFYSQIEFNAATFVQEWIKSVCSITVVFLLLEYQKYIFDLTKKKEFCRDNLERKIIHPLESLLAISNNWKNAGQDELDKLISGWSTANKVFTNFDIYSFNVPIKNNDLFDFYKQLHISDINREINGLMRLKAPQDVSFIMIKIEHIVNCFKTEVENLK